MKDYIFSNDFSRNLDAMIYTCGYETCIPGHSYGPAIRSGYMIHYILKGKGIYKTNGKIYQLSEGDAFLIKPDTLIYYEADHNHPWSYTWIGFQGIKMRQYFERTSLLEHPCFHYDKDDRVRLCHEKMYEAYHLTQNRDLILNSILYEYLYLLATKYPQENISPEAKKRSYVEDSLQYIEIIMIILSAFRKLQILSDWNVLIFTAFLKSNRLLPTGISSGLPYPQSL